MKIPTYKEINKVLKSLLSDFKDETNENTEWKFGDEGSWTENIINSDNMLKKLKSLKMVLPFTITNLYPAKGYSGKYNMYGKIQGIKINNNHTFESLGILTLDEIKNLTGISIKELKKLIKK